MNVVPFLSIEKILFDFSLIVSLIFKTVLYSLFYGVSRRGIGPEFGANAAGRQRPSGRNGDSGETPLAEPSRSGEGRRARVSLRPMPMKKLFNAH